MNSIAKFCAVSLALALLATTCLAVDIIKMKDGSVKKGKIVGETKTHITLKYFGNPIEIAKDEIKEIQRDVKTPKEEYRERYRKIDKKDTLDLLDLADWCTEKGLAKQARRLYEKVLQIEPDNDEAHEALGHRKVNGKWMTKEEYKEHRTKEQAGKANELPGGSGGDGAKKKVAITGGEGVKERAKQMLAKHKGAADAMAKEMIDEIGLDEVAASITDHYILAGQVPQATLDKLAIQAEVVYADVSARFNHAANFDLYKACGIKHKLLFFKTSQDYSDGFDYSAKKWAPGMMRKKKMAMGAGSFGIAPLAFDISRTLNDLESRVSNQAAQDFSYWHTRTTKQEAKENGRYMDWLGESMGCWSAMLHTGRNVIVRTTETVYNADVEIAKKRGEAGMRLLVKEWATGKMSADVSARDLRTMMMQKLNRLTFVDLAIGFALVDYCVREHQNEYKKFLILIRSKPYLQSWQEAFGKPLVPSFEKQFKDWVKKNY